jgi:hypothetical protein
MKGYIGDPANKSNYTVPGRLHAGEEFQRAVEASPDQMFSPNLFSPNLRITVSCEARLAEEYK